MILWNKIKSNLMFVFVSLFIIIGIYIITDYQKYVNILSIILLSVNTAILWSIKNALEKVIKRE